MQKLKLDRQVVIFSAVIVALALEFFILLPWSIGRIIQVNKRTRKTFQDIKVVKQEWPDKDAYLEKKGQLKKDIEAIRSKFITSQETSKLLSFISSASRDFKVEIESFSPLKVEEYTSNKYGQFKYIPIEIKAKSKFHNLALFLEYLYKSQYFFEIKDLKITSGYPYNPIEITICGLIVEK